MSETAQKLSARLESGKQKTLSFFSSLPDEIWQQKLYTDGAEWTVYEVLVHIVEAEGSLQQLFEHIANGGKGVGEDFDIDVYNKKAVANLVGADAAELMEEFSRLRADLIAMVNGFEEAQFENVGRHPFLGESRLDEMIRLFYLHVNLHIRDIRALLKG